MPVRRQDHQIWIYLQQESPFHTTLNLKDYENTFNWTMTYREDSDVYHPYFKINPRGKPPEDYQMRLSPIPDYEILQRKTKLVAWIVSNCLTPSRREDYVKTLKEYIPVDTFGACGDNSCTRKGNGCLPAIAQEYKFYLSFENSLCVDYITEKFSNAMKYDIVPIVYGGGDYESVAPHGSYIDTKDFESPKDLAEYLHFLDKNPSSYLEYFKWKAKYKVDVSDGWCSLCRKLRDHRKYHSSSNKAFKDLWRWWNHRPSSKTISDSSRDNFQPTEACSSTPIDTLS